MKSRVIKTTLSAIAVLFLASCNNDDDNQEPEVINEEELITTVTWVLTAEGEDPITFTSFDSDGDEGPEEPQITGGTLKANTTYTGVITVLNATKTPPENITEEIEEEDDEHQFFFTPDAGLNISVSYGDKDENDFPVGLESTITTGEASTGKLAITLLHQPAKDAEGVAEGDITNAGDDPDFSIRFDVTIEE